MKSIAGQIVAVTLPLAACGGTPAQVQPRYLLNGEAVARALHADGLDVQPEQVRLAAPVSAAVERPALELFGADRLPDGRVRMRLRCHRASDCFPFSVTIERAPGAAVPVPRFASAAMPAQPSTIAKSGAYGSSPAALVPAQASLIPTAQASLTPTVQAAPAAFPAGAKLTLLLEQGHVHIHLPVVALDSSAAGPEVRVCTPDHKQTFRASVVDATTVRGIVE